MSGKNPTRKTVSCCKVFSLVTAIVMLFTIHVWSTPALAAQILKIGLLEEPKTLNIWRATDRWSSKVLGLIYQPLYLRNPDTLELIPWLAAEAPVFDPQTLSYTVKLRPAKWSDGTEFTSADVAFTGSVIQEFKVPKDLSRWKFVKKIETPDKHTVRFYLEEPMAIFTSTTLTTSIVQEKEWAKIVEEARKTEKPLKRLLNEKITNPVGCGPFVLKEWRQGAYLFLERNNLFFGKGQKICDRLLGPYIDGVIFKIFGTSDAAILAMKKGTIDMFWWGIQPGYIDDLKASPDIELFSSEQSALYFVGFNLRKPPFNDPNLRRAAVTIIDEDFIISRILQGYGIRMYSIVPPGNKFWYCPDVPRYCNGCSREQRIKKAYEILEKAGYTWEVPPVDKGGQIVHGAGIRMPDGKPMEKFTILTPPADYDPNRAMAGMMMQEWLRELGIPAYARPMAFSALIDQVKMKHDFDAFVLGYGRLSLDPDYLRNFFITKNDRPRGWNMSGYSNPDYDRIADESASEMDVDKRKQLIWEMQKILMRDVPYFPLYNPKLIEAVRKGEFSGWVEMLGGIGNIWSYCQLKPK
jgi:peptide/nickel transport system substrate-binding protein